MTQADEPAHLGEFVAKMAAAGLAPFVIETFSRYYRRLAAGESGLIGDADILPVQPDELPDESALAPFGPAGREALPRSVQIVLNGGLGTSMGLRGPKSLLPVRPGLTFLAIILERARADGSRIALMNSFNTQAETAAALARLAPEPQPLCFLQHRFPKVRRADLRPAVWPADPELEWNPPGHGDVYAALFASGTLDRLLAEGVRYALIRNVDNLGAGMKPEILGYFADRGLPFLMEVAEKTPADVKGGHLARRRDDGRLILREAAQCPKAELSAFQDIRRYRFFNTNNIWIRLDTLREAIRGKGGIDLPMIVNPKTLDPRDETSPPVYQIETAMGAAISFFEGAAALRVPRSRFLPVKTCNDLLAVASDCFVISPERGFVLNPAREASGRDEVIRIRLDPRYYGKYERFAERFPEGPPSLIECDALTVEGDVRFEAGVRIRGTVTIKNRRDRPAVIPAGSLLDGDLEL
ncbi:MAG: UTP--glucose-1-phosphate uridylyltransferase [Desulfobacterales bacterium]